MHISDVLEKLKEKYPGKQIVLNNRREVTEILCEVDPTKDHKGLSTAIAVIDKTLPHYHKYTSEVYTVIEGELTLIVDGKKVELKKGQSHTIHPHQVHEAIGNETWVEVKSRPGWTKEDHIVVKSVKNLELSF